MNKYDTKVLEVAPKNGTIQELIRRKVRGPFFTFIDMMIGNLFFAADGLSSKGAYYLLVSETKAELIHIEPSLETSQQDVTNVIQHSAHQRSFKFEGYKYKIARKIR